MWRDPVSMLQASEMGWRSKFAEQVLAAAASSPDRARRPVRIGNIQEQQGKRGWLSGFLLFFHEEMVTFVHHSLMKHGEASGHHLLFQYINNIRRHGGKEIHDDR